MSVCKRCGAPILWVRTAKHGKSMPLDAAPVAVGNVVLRAGAAVVLDLPDRDLALSRGETVYRPHFASCPNYPRRTNAGVR